MQSIPRLKEKGVCSICKQPVPIEATNFCNTPENHKHKGRNCKGSGYTAYDVVYVIETPEEAKQVADFIIGDNPHRCLGYLGGGMHSMACNDGENCNHVRHHLARALAVYYLSVLEPKKEVKVA